MDQTNTPPPCEECLNNAGTVRSISRDNGIETRSFRCPACGRMWEVSRPASELGGPEISPYRLTV